MGTPSEGSKEEVVELFGPSSNLSFTEYREQPILFSGKLAGIKEREREKEIRFIQISNPGSGRCLGKGVSVWLFAL